jgi:hypothetical protein
MSLNMIIDASAVINSHVTSCSVKAKEAVMGSGFLCRFSIQA